MSKPDFNEFLTVDVEEDEPKLGSGISHSFSVPIRDVVAVFSVQNTGILHEYDVVVALQNGLQIRVATGMRLDSATFVFQVLSARWHANLEKRKEWVRKQFSPTIPKVPSPTCASGLLE
ncbi:MAG: hypothetical protein AAB495_03715 [Patescibacteria group bacterium]